MCTRNEYIHYFMSKILLIILRFIMEYYLYIGINNVFFFFVYILYILYIGTLFFIIYLENLREFLKFNNPN